MMLHIFISALFLPNIALSYKLAQSRAKSLKSTFLHDITTETDLSLIPTSTLVKSFFDQLSPVENPKINNSINIQDISKTLKLPQAKDEAWRHSNLRALFTSPITRSPVQALSIESIQSYISPDCIHSHIVFVDGHYSATLSDISDISSSISNEGLIFKPLSQMNDNEISTDIYDALSHISDLNQTSRDSFGSDTISILNLQNLQDALIIKVPNDMKLSTPIQVLYVSSQHNNKVTQASFPRLYIHASKNSHIEVRQMYVISSSSSSSSSSSLTNKSESHHTVDSTPVALTESLSTSSSSSSSSTPTESTMIITGDGDSEVFLKDDVTTVAVVDTKKQGQIFVTGNTRVIVEEGSSVIHTYTQELSDSSRMLDVISAEIQKDSRYVLTAMQMGGGNTRLNVHTNILGENANCTMTGVMLCEQGQNTDIRTSILHDTPYAVSRQQQRLVIGEQGQGIFKGKIKIPQHAQHTDSDQLCRSIMLGDKARVIAMPTLEITADNVVCSHGASVADMDPNSIFYLTSRGLPRVLARKLLLKAFVFEVIEDYVTDKNLLKRISDKMEKMAPKIDTGMQKGGKYVSM